MQQNVVQLLYCPPITRFRWNVKVLSMIFCYPLCQFRGKPAENRMCSAVRVGYPLWPLVVTCARNETMIWMCHCFMRGRFQQVNVQAFLAVKVVSCSRIALSRPCFASLGLLNICIICYITCYITGYIRVTWMVWRFLSPDMMAWSTGYLIPSSQDIPSSLSAIIGVISMSSSSSSLSASSKSVCKVRRY
jgi:hypothetical protein